MVAVGTTVNHVSLVDLRAGANIHHLRGHTDSVVVCKWSNRDENLLATGNNSIFLSTYFAVPRDCFFFFDFKAVAMASSTCGTFAGERAAFDVLTTTIYGVISGGNVNWMTTSERSGTVIK